MRSKPPSCRPACPARQPRIANANACGSLKRTIDNLKRLYAVLFSISFGIVAFGVFKKLERYEDPNMVYSWYSFFVEAELTVAFVMTAGLFYYQGDRFLDVSYARGPLCDR